MFQTSGEKVGQGEEGSMARLGTPCGTYVFHGHVFSLRVTFWGDVRVGNYMVVLCLYVEVGFIPMCCCCGRNKVLDDARKVRVRSSSRRDGAEAGKLHMHCGP